MSWFRTGTVSSVNGQSGTVILTGANVGPIYAADITKVSATAQLIGGTGGATTPYGEQSFSGVSYNTGVAFRSGTGSATAVRGGTTATRPPIVLDGMIYLDTTLGIPIFSNAGAWVNATGLPV